MEILELKSELQKSLKIIDTLKKINIIEQKGTTPLSGNKKKLNYVENRESLKISGKTVYTDPESVAHTIMPVMCNTKTAPIKVINLTSTMDGCLRTEDVVIDNVTDRITTKENDCTKLEDIISKENINRKIMIVADDQGKNMQRNIQKLVGKEFFVSCFWKPGANMHEVLLSEKTEICKEKLSVGASEPVRLVLESDGTQVEDGDYWRTLPPNTVLLLLRQGERWYPTGVDVIKAAISAIPKIVCETIHALELHDETPSWKIMDNKGRVTVVLHWDQRPQASPAARSPSRQAKPDRRPSLVIQTSLDRPQPPPPHITVVNHDEPGPGPASVRGRLSRGPGSLEHTPGGVHVHTAECRATSTSPAPAPPPLARPPLDECDFHCCALHEEGRRIAVHKSVATSPIQDAQPRASPQGRPKGHVRFLDAESARRGDRDSSESETENTLVEDEAVTSEKFLLLIDQLSVDQKRHLTIKDIGIILERLSSKILDVERLDRESESDDCYNWTIKATIRGDALRELGVIYNGNYYAISEHPGYREENEEAGDEGEEEEEEDRL
ncbi:hypothetical protein K1T71_003640 [Dendrolimus kikuchii]|uniref:Uncharacterized protein n=1 Tax=Dendrolimus kikuchii TaxID=765133 RepID=A0ACC1D8K7_9NEOP|nr:hypothetical protein K1T71_003640 [Dendrolimus kikuchii]